LTAVDQTAVVSDFFRQNYSYIHIESGHGVVVLSHLPTVYSMQYGTFPYWCLRPIPRPPHFKPLHYLTFHSWSIMCTCGLVYTPAYSYQEQTYFTLVLDNIYTFSAIQKSKYR